MFTPTNMLKKYLAAQPRDMYDIVGALIGYINADPYFQTNDFEDAIRYTLSEGVSEDELFQPFDSEKDFKEDETKWDEDYYSYARVYLKDNFCKKRIKHVKEVAHKLRSVEKPVTTPREVQPERNDDSTGQRLSTVPCSLGGQQSEGKKPQGHQKKHTITPKFVGIKGLAICVVIILMVIIVYIMSRNR